MKWSNPESIGWQLHVVNVNLLVIMCPEHEQGTDELGELFSLLVHFLHIHAPPFSWLNWKGASSLSRLLLRGPSWRRCCCCLCTVDSAQSLCPRRSPPCPRGRASSSSAATSTAATASMLSSCSFGGIRPTRFSALHLCAHIRIRRDTATTAPRPTYRTSSRTTTRSRPSRNLRSLVLLLSPVDCIARRRC